MTQPPKPQSVAINDRLSFGPGSFVVAAGPCAVESRKQLAAAAAAVKGAGAAMLRGGAFKPRTRPSSFQGLGEEGLRLLREVSLETGLPVVTEVLDPRHVELTLEYAAMLQVGSRSMQNFPLLREVGKTSAPILLKRGAAATLDELLAAAEYILEEGNEQVVLCERGVRSFDSSQRYLLDLAAVPALKARTGMPILVDPSHGTGRRDLVPSLALAALAVGADGLILELHPEPEKALSDGPQALRPDDFSLLMHEIRQWIPPTGRYLPGVEPAPAEPQQR